MAGQRLVSSPDRLGRRAACLHDQERGRGWLHGGGWGEDRTGQGLSTYVSLEYKDEVTIEIVLDLHKAWCL